MLVRSPRPQVRQARGGFTLLEVLVVTAILLILASVATFATVRYLEQAKRSEAKLQMQKIETAAKAYYTQYNAWPQSGQELIMPEEGLPPLLEGGESAILDPWQTPYQISTMTDNYGAVRVVVVSTGSGVEIQWPQR